MPPHVAHGEDAAREVGPHVGGTHVHVGVDEPWHERPAAPLDGERAAGNRRGGHRANRHHPPVRRDDGLVFQQARLVHREDGDVGEGDGSGLERGDDEEQGGKAAGERAAGAAGEALIAVRNGARNVPGESNPDALPPCRLDLQPPILAPVTYLPRAPVSDATTPVIVAACRTPIGKYLGGLEALKAPQLGAIAIREAVRRAGVDVGLIDEVIMGHVVQGGTGQAPGRQAAIGAGIPGTVPALTINKVCGSGLKAVMLAAQSIKAGDNACVVAGGQESMSTAPHYVYGMRNGIKAGNQTMVDGMIHDGLWDSFGSNHMGEYAEYTATKAGISRKDQDEFAFQSHRKAVAAQEAGHVRPGNRDGGDPRTGRPHAW